MRELVIATVFGISVLGDQTPVRELVAGLSSGDAAVRAKAACELKDQGDRAGDAIDALVRLLGDATPVNRDVCRERWWQGRDDETTPGHLAAAALVGIGSRSVPALITALQLPQWISRKNATWALGALDDPRGVPPVTAALQDREAPVRQQAAWALGAMDASSAVQGLIGALKDPDEGVRQQAAWALGSIGSKAAAPALTQSLKDTDARVRHQSAWALGSIGDRSAVPGLVEALRDADKGVRSQAAWALGSLGDSRATEGLVSALKDTDSSCAGRPRGRSARLAGDGRGARSRYGSIDETKRCSVTSDMPSAPS